MKKFKLQPCPACGSYAKISQVREGEYSVLCSDPDCPTFLWSMHPSPEEAVKAWNKAVRGGKKHDKETVDIKRRES